MNDWDHCNCLDVRVCLQCGRPGFDSWVRKIPWRRKWLPTPVILPGESHGQRNLKGYSPWGHTESGTTERLMLHFHWSTKDLEEGWATPILLEGPDLLSHVQLFYDLMDYRSPCSSLCSWYSPRILEWVAISFSRGSSWPRDWIHVSCIFYIPDGFFMAQPQGKLKEAGEEVDDSVVISVPWREGIIKGFSERSEKGLHRPRSQRSSLEKSRPYHGG